MKILLADDHGLFRDSMAVWLKQYEQDVQIEFAADWESLNEHLDDDLNLLMLDLGMPGMSGAASICSIIKQIHDVPVLVVSANEDRHTIKACLECGASGYITKASSGQEILKAVSTVMKGEIYQPPKHLQQDSLGLEESFSKKQFQLLALLAEGESNRDISQQLSLSEGTVKQYVSQLLDMLGVDNRTQAGNKARKILGMDN